MAGEPVHYRSRDQASRIPSRRGWAGPQRHEAPKTARISLLVHVRDAPAHANKARLEPKGKSLQCASSGSHRFADSPIETPQVARTPCREALGGRPCLGAFATG